MNCAFSLIGLVVFVVALFAGPASAEELSAEQRATAHWIVEQARAWADQACRVWSRVQDSTAAGRQA